MKKFFVIFASLLATNLPAQTHVSGITTTVKVLKPEATTVAPPRANHGSVPIVVAPNPGVPTGAEIKPDSQQLWAVRDPGTPVDWGNGPANGWYVPPEQLAAQAALQQQPAMQQQGVPGQPVAAQQWSNPGTVGGVFNSTGAAQARRYYSGGGYYPNGVYTVNGLVPPIRYNSWGWYAGADAGYSSYYGGSGGAYFNSHNHSGTHGGFGGNGTAGGYFNSHRGNSGSGNTGTTGTFSSGRQGTGSSSGGTAGVFNSHRANGGATSSGTAGGVFNSKRR